MMIQLRISHHWYHICTVTNLVQSQAKRQQFHKGLKLSLLRHIVTEFTWGLRSHPTLIFPSDSVHLKQWNLYLSNQRHVSCRTEVLTSKNPLHEVSSPNTDGTWKWGDAHSRQTSHILWRQKSWGKQSQVKVCMYTPPVGFLEMFYEADLLSCSCWAEGVITGWVTLSAGNACRLVGNLVFCEDKTIGASEVDPCLQNYKHVVDILTRMKR